MGDNVNELSKKLGIPGDTNAYTLHAPSNYLQAITTPSSLKQIEGLENNIDWIQAFYADEQSIRSEIAALKRKLSHTGQIWISWPKKSSGVSSDLTDATVRQIGLDHGLVDVKVSAINETWSALKFVYRLADRTL
jgi:hypothetical protein